MEFDQQELSRGTFPVSVFVAEEEAEGSSLFLHSGCDFTARLNREGDTETLPQSDSHCVTSSPASLISAA